MYSIYRLLMPCGGCKIGAVDGNGVIVGVVVGVGVSVGDGGSVGGGSVAVGLETSEPPIRIPRTKNTMAAPTVEIMIPCFAFEFDMISVLLAPGHDYR
jgi:hypothetical protein